ncbi:hypothetical protein, partial [Burkholderia cenocepacia]|uniref:hypothetical protein n=1 Tax=Burkholderia cenocepacia TaxID=95486 RepID=UPI002232B00B
MLKKFKEARLKRGITAKSIGTDIRESPHLLGNEQSSAAPTGKRPAHFRLVVVAVSILRERRFVNRLVRTPQHR